MKVCIIGAGASGILLSLLLHQAGISPSEICLVDPHFDGGALQREWPNVISNTTWAATTEAFRCCLPSHELPAWAKHLSPDQPTPLRTIAKLLRDLYSPLKFKTVRGHVHQASWNSQTTTWTCSIQSGDGIVEINSKRILFTQGSRPKHFDIPIPSIPLKIALDANLLKSYVNPNDHVVVFGTNHSGILALKNLVDCSVERIVGVYKGAVPFIWARDGEYDGLKLDGATIADSILAGQYPTVKLVSYGNVSEIVRETRNSTWAIFAAGFTADTTIRMTIDGADVTIGEYDPNTGVLRNGPNAWGFGIAYPSQAPDGIHYDVGISSFLEHFYKQIPDIITNL
jgi:hypothetical protein